MKLGKLKKDFGLNWGISFDENPLVWNRLAKVLNIWCFRFTELPPEGSAMESYKYKGFWIRKELMTDWNVIVHTKTIRFPYWIKIKKE